MALKDIWTDRVDGDKIDLNDTNLLANELINTQEDLEETQNNIPTKNSQLENDSDFATKNYVDSAKDEAIAKIPKKVSQLSNDKEYTTKTEVDSIAQEIEKKIPQKLSDLDKDTSFKVYESDLSTSLKGKVNTAYDNSENAVETLPKKENIANKITEILKTATHTQYPTAKASYEAIENAKNTAMQYASAITKDYIYGSEIDDKYNANSIIPQILTYINDGYENSPVEYGGIIITAMADETGEDENGKYAIYNQWAIGNNGELKHRLVTYGEINYKVPWTDNFIPKKVSQLTNDRGYITTLESNQIYANALKGFVTENIIALDDVSPVPHIVKCQLEGENIEGTTVTTSGANLFDVFNAEYIESKAYPEVSDDGTLKVTSSVNGSYQYLYFSIYKPTIPETIFISYKARMGTDKTVPLVRIRYKNSESGATTTLYGVTDLTQEWKSYAYKLSITEARLEEYDTIEIIAYSNNSSTAIPKDEAYVELKDIMISKFDLPYEPYEGETYTPDTDGKIEINSISPIMNISSDAPNVVINAEYNRDINKAFEQLQNVILSLGGNV